MADCTCLTVCNAAKTFTFTFQTKSPKRMSDINTFFEAAKMMAEAYGLTELGGTFTNEGIKTIAAESVKKLFQSKPDAKKAIEEAKAQPETDDSDPITQLAEELSNLAEEDQKFKAELQQWQDSIKQLVQDAKQGREIRAENYFERIENVNQINFDQRGKHE
jgi:hypothetical protein